MTRTGGDTGPTGVAVDGKGRIWTTNYHTRTVSRIDPSAGPLGSDGVTPVGRVDFTSQDLGGTLDTRSDLTGSTLRRAVIGGMVVRPDPQLGDQHQGGWQGTRVR